MARHSDLSLCKPEKLSHLRGNMANSAIIEHYYTKLKVVEDHSIAPKYILDCDATGMPLRLKKVFKKSKNVWASGDKLNIIVLASVIVDR